MARVDGVRDDDASGWRQRAVSRSLGAARSRAEQRVQRLLDAAFELIDEKGTSDFTIQEVVDRSKQSLRGFYQYFDGKDELLFALLEETIRESHEDLRESVESASEPLDLLLEMYGCVRASMSGFTRTATGARRPRRAASRSRRASSARRSSASTRGAGLVICEPMWQPTPSTSRWEEPSAEATRRIP